MKIDIAEGASPECEQFLKGCADARLCHTPRWSHMLRDAMGYKTFYLVAWSEGKVAGVLPITKVSSFIFGRRLISQAFSNYGGPIAAGNDVRGLLIDKAVDIGRDEGCKSAIFRNEWPVERDLGLVKDKVTMRLPLASDPENVWSSLRPEIRNRVRKATKAGLEVRSGGEELLLHFYRVYCLRMKELGTPPYPVGMMRSILRSFPGNSKIFVVWHGGVVVGGAFTLSYNGLAEIPWVSCLRRFNRLAPNMLLYWSVIEHYSRDRARFFDFGRSTRNGPHYEFKRRWGAQEVQLNYQFWTAGTLGQALPSSQEPKYAFMIQVWKRMPLWITRSVGSMISRGIP